MTLKDELDKLAKATKLLGESPKKREEDRREKPWLSPSEEYAKKES